MSRRCLILYIGNYDFRFFSTQLENAPKQLDQFSLNSKSKVPHPNLKPAKIKILIDALPFFKDESAFVNPPILAVPMRQPRPGPLIPFLRMRQGKRKQPQNAFTLS